MVSGGRNANSEAQATATPLALTAAVARRWGTIVFDIAADRDNRVAAAHWTEADDALLPTRDWASAVGLDGDGRPGVGWLNPPFSRTGDFVARACRERFRLADGAAFAVLVPASVGSVWWRESVWGSADVAFLSPRVTFVGHRQPYPKDLALLIYRRPGRVCSVYAWDWKVDALVRVARCAP